MKILMLGWELPPYNSGGLGVACFQLAKALADHGAKIDFVLPPKARFEQQTFMNIHSTPVRTSIDREIVDVTEYINPYSYSISEVRKVQQDYIDFVDQLVIRNRPHVVHAHDWLTLEAGVHVKKRRNIPLVAHVHATEFDRAGGGHGNPLIHEIEQHGLMAADYIFAVSEITKQIIVDNYHIPPENIQVVHNGPEELAEHYTDMMNYKYLKTLKNEGYTVVAVISRLTIQKGLNYFLQAAQKAQSRHGRMVFIIAGDGEQRDEMIQMSADLGISDSVLFTGFVRGAAWRDLYNIADVFVMSSVSEPFGLTALEAAQHNTAITITKQSGVNEVLKNVLRYDYWDVDMLADQLIAMAGSRALVSALAHNVGHEVRTLSWNKIAHDIIGHYKTVVEANI